MKYSASIILCALAVGSAERKGTLSPDTMREVKSCTDYVSQFLSGSVTKDVALRKASDFCATDGSDNTHACPHFGEAVEASLDHFAADDRIDAQMFCQATEEHMNELRGATRLTGVGHGPLVNFKISRSCPRLVMESAKPKTRMDSKTVPDFWYTLCMNQDCAHFLPSRTRWCNVGRQPTHSASVCEAARRFAEDEVSVRKETMLDGEQVCGIYAEFVAEMAIDVESYEHVVHAETARRLPVPSSSVRALQSTRLRHEADESKFKNEPEAPKSGATSMAPPALVLGALLMATL